MNAVTLVYRTKVYRVLFLTLVCIGAFNASVYPYQSLIAIRHIGLTPGDFALVLLIASAVNVAAAVLLGIIADQRANRRLTALLCAGAGALAMALMLLVPGPVAMVLTAAVLLPLAQPLYGQVFALTRLASQGREAQADAVQAVIRTALSIAFVVVLAFWTLAFSYGLPVMAVYLSGAAASLCAVFLVLRAWPRDGQTAWQDRRSGLNLPAALRQIARPHVTLRFFCLGAVGAAGGIYMATISLVFDASVIRGAPDVALYVGMVAAWEVPFMLLLPRVLHRFSRSTLIGAGAAVYVLHLMALHLVADTPALWLMPLFAGLGGAALLTLPISYYQNLLSGAPGTAVSLMALQKLVSDGLVAGSFALGMALSGLTLVAAFGAGLSLAGALLLVLADRRRWLLPQAAP